MHIILTSGEPRGLQEYFIKEAQLSSVPYVFLHTFVLQTPQFASIFRSFYLAAFFGTNATISLPL